MLIRNFKLREADQDWRSALPDDLKADPTIKDFKDISSLVKSYKETKALVGASIRVPGENASDEAKKEFREKLKKHVPSLVEIPDDPKELAAVEADLWDKLGRPKDEKEYTAEGVEIPEGFDATSLRAAAKKLGMTKAQFKAFAEEAVASHKAQAEAVQQAQAGLRKEWGVAYDERVAAAQVVAVKLGVPAEAVKSMPVNQIKVWYNVAKTMGVERAEAAGQPTGDGKLTPAEAKAQIADILTNPAYFDKKHPKHMILRKKMMELRQMEGDD